MVHVWCTRVSKTTLYPLGHRRPLFSILNITTAWFPTTQASLFAAPRPGLPALLLSATSQDKPRLSRRLDVRFYHLQSWNHLEVGLVLNPQAVRSSWLPSAHDHAVPLTWAPLLSCPPALPRAWAHLSRPI